MTWMRQTLVALIAFAVLASAPGAAHATDLLACTANGGVVKGTSLFQTELAAEKDSGKNSFCRKAIPKKKQVRIFSQVLCDFLTVLNDVLGQVYCGIQHDMVGLLRIVFSIYVAAYGAQMLMGTAQANARDFLMRLFKLTLVYAFATNSEYAIGILFQGAVAFISSASYWVLNAVPALQGVDVGPEHCGNLQFNKAGNVMPLFDFFDCLIEETFIGSSKYLTLKVVGFLVAMCVAYTPFTVMGMMWAVKTFLLMVKAVINLLLALAAIAFLIAMCPIFFSFMLFHTTFHFFDAWVRYMISYCVQIVLVFSTLVIWIVVFITFLSGLDDLSKVVFPYNPAVQAGSATKPAKTWGICPTVVSMDANDVPHAKCIDSGFNPTGPNWEEDAKKVRPPQEIITDGKFLYFLFYHLVSMMIITYMFAALLDFVPKIAQSIASPAQGLMPLGGGLGMLGSKQDNSTDNIRGSRGSISRNAAPTSPDPGKR